MLHGVAKGACLRSENVGNLFPDISDYIFRNCSPNKFTCRGSDGLVSEGSNLLARSVGGCHQAIFIVIYITW